MRLSTPLRQRPSDAAETVGSQPICLCRFGNRTIISLPGRRSLIFYQRIDVERNASLRQPDDALSVLRLQLLQHLGSERMQHRQPFDLLKRGRRSLQFPAQQLVGAVFR